MELPDPQPAYGKFEAWQGFLMAFVAAFVFLRKHLGRPWRAAKAFLATPRIIIAQIGEMAESIKGIQVDVTAVKKFVGRSELIRIQAFESQPRPALEMSGVGEVTLASTAVNRLLRADKEGSIYGTSYLQFLDSAEVNEFISSFSNAAEHHAEFRFAAKIYDRQRNYRGIWEFFGEPIGPRVQGQTAELYVVMLRPQNPVAKDIAERAGWEV